MGQSKPYGFGKNETELNYSVDSAWAAPTTASRPARRSSRSSRRPRWRRAIRRRRSTRRRTRWSTRARSRPATASRGPTSATGPLENESESEAGRYRLKKAMGKSVNTYFVQMISRHRPVPGGRDGRQARRPARATATSCSSRTPRITLGPSGHLPADDGRRVRRRSPTAARTARRSPSSRSPDGRRQAESLRCRSRRAPGRCREQTADTINTLLKGVVEDGTGTAGRSQRPRQRGQDGYDGRAASDAWFVGYTPNLSAAVWVGERRPEASR